VDGAGRGKTGRNELRAAQIESYLDLARQEGFEAVLTISNQLVTAAGEHPVAVDGRKTKKVSLHHLSWSQVYTEALIQQGNRSVADPDQAWILAEFVRYLGHPRSGAVDFDDMGPLWVAVRDAARSGTLTQNDNGAAEVTNRFGQLISFAAMGLSRQLGVQVAPALSPTDAKDPGGRLKAAVVTFTETGRLHGALSVPHAIAPIEITADLRAGQVHCSVTVAAPKTGKPATRVNWLARQLREAPGDLCIEPIAAWQRGKGAAKSLAQVREDPKVLVDDPKRELRAFTVSLSANGGTKRGQGKGSFVSSVVSAIDRFYVEVVQHIKPWTQAPPKVKDDEPSPADQPVAAETATAEAHDIEIGNGLPSRESALTPTPGLTESAGDRLPERSRWRTLTK
jgi:hypothetical protein